ncbi:MAG: hypothetical protein M3P91_08275 [Actinomycetota bacterium]|nr:hypothetical protein [Actinomycetota bacterium]
MSVRTLRKRPRVAGHATSARWLTHTDWQAATLMAEFVGMAEWPNDETVELTTTALGEVDLHNYANLLVVSSHFTEADERLVIRLEVMENPLRPESCQGILELTFDQVSDLSVVPDPPEDAMEERNVVYFVSHHRPSGFRMGTGRATYSWKAATARADPVR